eukprot:m.35003 g.35003  ORF g.35003 m.35003 type:complete len:151 (+) comp6574_c1_seq5:1039-1491(+)
MIQDGSQARLELMSVEAKRSLINKTRNHRFEEEGRLALLHPRNDEEAGAEVPVVAAKVEVGAIVGQEEIVPIGEEEEADREALNVKEGVKMSAGEEVEAEIEVAGKENTNTSTTKEVEVEAEIEVMTKEDTEGEEVEKNRLDNPSLFFLL